MLPGLTEVQEWTTAGGVPLMSAVIPADHHQVWRQLRAEHRHTGWYPLLTWGAAVVAEDSFEYSNDIQGPEALARALEVDPAERMELLTRSVIGWGLEEYPGSEIEEFREHDPELLAAELVPVTTRPPGRRIYTSAEGEYEVLLVQATAGYEIPALVPGLIRPANWFGAEWHPDLTIEDHVAVYRLWHHKYGADLYFAGGSQLELAVTRPPVTPLETAKCAIEQWVYCGDLAQKLGDPVDVARRQAPADHWSFWWD
ncbi:DUF4253 domain-containing protein [Actinoplanes friuliensis]|uniref:DUF4253 domain-containing protein n=1 Tax=Actinoplanes friuliensis DSM 7358 TaxID=1246995 RepID=U5VSL3_9ACTN|nr:DUF4253 domain-containing protein [Actinoplanes friuliensis]AGZ38616.1 hypothetical protein AFR_01635 [Actinoplanes friuliensis DSM 7358]